MMKKFDLDKSVNEDDLIAGIDEAGRGPVAGPVVAACVVLDYGYDYGYINDSKQMTEKERLNAYNQIIKHAKSYGVGIVSNEEIDKINILEATKLAMLEALSNLDLNPDLVLVDAVKINAPYKSMSIIKGDTKSLAIAAASIIAKVTRDKLMNEYDSLYPKYGFSRHKGYLTKLHQDKIKEFGPCEIHRKSFAPIKDYYVK
ncbi:MAG: ribonuclease HII [Acholeplasma sp.]|nr:ribonuclease HII [Acholeplasma sp.]